MSRAAEASPLLSPALHGEAGRGEPEMFPPTSNSRSSSSRPDDDGDASYTRARYGFYLFSVASEVWVIAAGTLFLPVIVETYARAHGRLGPDYSTPCPPSSTSSSSSDASDAATRCAVRIAFSWIDTASFSLAVYSTSVAVQALTVISIGTLADDSFLRHRLLLSFATVGSLASASFVLLPANSAVWQLCALFALVANVSFGVTSVCLNSYLPAVAKLAPEVVAAETTLSDSRSWYDSVRSSRRSSSELHEASTALSRATSRLVLAKSIATSETSSKAIALGYAAGISVLVALVPLVKSLTPSAPSRSGIAIESDETWPLRVAIGISATCWLIGSFVASRYLDPSSIAASETTRQCFSSDSSRAQPRDHTRSESVIESVQSSWRGLGTTLKEWRRLPSTFVFLSAWFLLSDSFATLTSTAMLFAKTTLHLSTSSLVIVAILTPSAGIIGAVVTPALQRREYLPRSNLAIVKLAVALATLIPTYGLAALSTQLELYLVAVAFGFVYGAFQSFARTAFVELVPASQAGRWFGLYAITDKSSSFFGPLLVSIITNRTGQIRYGFWLILGLFLCALPILDQVDMERGTRDVDKFEQDLEQEEDNYDEEEQEENELRLSGGTT